MYIDKEQKGRSLFVKTSHPKCFKTINFDKFHCQKFITICKSLFISYDAHMGVVRALLHTGKFSSDKKISFVLNPLVAHGRSQDKEKLPVQGKFSCV